MRWWSVPEAKTAAGVASGRRSHQPETILLLSLALAGVLFGFTGFAARRFHASEKSLAQRWYNRGQSELAAGRSSAAIEDFRTALAYSPGAATYQLSLARALAAARRLDEARNYLLGLWLDEPSDGEANLELGRIELQEGSIPGALRYYHNAIYGIWRDQPEAAARNARLELCQALVARNDEHDAEAELIALSGDLPDDADLHARVGDLFLRTGDYQRALRHFARALALDRKHQDALAGAGTAAFELGRYDEARNYLERALKAAPGNAQVAERFELSRQVVEADPYEPRLSAQERSSRVAAAYDQSLARLEACAQAHGDLIETSQPQTLLESVYNRGLALKSQVREAKLARDPDLINTVMDLVVDAEKAATDFCGPAKGLDEAIVLATQRHQAGQ